MRKPVIKLAKVYVVNVEDPGDYYFRPEGVLFVDEKGNHTLYAHDSRHNFLKAAVQKFPWEELTEGVSFREHTVRLIDLTSQMDDLFFLLVDEMPDMLQRLYDGSPRQYFFLEKYLEQNRQH